MPHEFDETLLLLGTVPIFRQRTLFLRCESCKRSSLSTERSLDAFVALNDIERSASLRTYTSGVGRVVVVFALVLFWAPFVGLPLALLGLAMTWRNRRWRRWAIVGIALSSVITAAVTALLLFHK